MLTKSEKFRAIIEMVADNIDSYIPSYHVYNLYANEEVTDLHEAVEGYRETYKRATQDMMEMALSEEDWDETNPGALFYVDETDMNQCFLVVEAHLVESISMSFFASGFDLLEGDLEFEDE